MAMLLLAVCSSLGIVFPDLDALLPPPFLRVGAGLSTKPWGAPCFLLAHMKPTGGRVDGTSSRVQKWAPTASGKNYVLTPPFFLMPLTARKEVPLNHVKAVVAKVCLASMLQSRSCTKK